MDDSSSLTLLQKAGLSLEHLGQMLEWLNEGILILEAENTRILYVNPRFSEMVQAEAGELIGRDASEWLNEQELRYWQQQSEIIDKTGRNRFEFSLPTRSGSRIPVIQSVREIHTQEGKRLLLVNSIDISEQKRIYSELEAVNRRLMEYHDQLTEDLLLAEQIQRTLITTREQTGRIQITTRYLPVMGIGGDYVFVHTGLNDKVYLTVCDVSGHGVAASLVANYVNATTRQILEKGVEGPGDLLQQLNKTSYALLKNQYLYFTYAAVELDPQTCDARIASGGHPPILHVYGHGTVQSFTGPFTMLGKFHPLPQFGKEHSVQLQTGDRLVLYTDGITEARRPGTVDQLGVNRLIHILANNHHVDAETVCDMILNAVIWHTEKHIEDDMTLLIATVIS